MEEVLNVLGVVEGSCGGGALRDLLLVAGLTRVDTWKISGVSTMAKVIPQRVLVAHL